MIAARGVLFAIVVMLASSSGSAQFFLFPSPVTLDALDGNYRTLAACAYAHLVRHVTGLSRSEPQQGVIRMFSAAEGWELSFVDDEAGRQTRLVWTAGGYPREFVLSTVRACAA